MRFRFSFLSAIALLFAAASSLAAQICLGRPGATERTMYLGGYIDKGGGSQFSGFTAGALGAESFALVTAGRATFDALDGSALDLSGVLGRQLSLGSTGVAQLCPNIGVGFGYGPRNIEGTGIDASSKGVIVSLDFGFLTVNTDRTQVALSTSAGFGYSVFKLSDNFDSVEETTTYGILGFGIGVTMNRRFTLFPALSVPIGLDEADPWVSLSIGALIGPPR
jgi:hypothetical protein